MRTKRRGVFLDRDGTLLTERGYLRDPSKIRFYPSAFKGLAILQKAGFRLFVVTNQSGVGRGYFSLDDLKNVHRRMSEMLKRKGISLSGIYVCPHRPDAGCACRKPKPKLPRLAAKRFNLDLRSSFVIGDQVRDLHLAKAIHAGGVLVLTGWGRAARKKLAKGFPVSRNLESAAKRIVTWTDKN